MRIRICEGLRLLKRYCIRPNGAVSALQLQFPLVQKAASCFRTPFLVRSRLHNTYLLNPSSHPCNHIETSIYFCLKYLSTIIAIAQTTISISGLLFCIILLTADITNIIAKIVDVISVAFSRILIAFNCILSPPYAAFTALCYNKHERR